MKCENCGGNITLEMAYCPYCGLPNEHAQQHAKDMETYHAVYEDTRSDVQEKTARFTGATVRIVIIAVLIIVIIGLMILGANAYSFRRSYMQKAAEKNTEAYMEQLDQYMEDEDFLAFYYYWQEKYIDSYETDYEKYMPVERACHSYVYIYKYIMQIAAPTDYQDAESILEYLTDSLDNFYRAIDMDEYEYYENVDSEQNREALAAMEKHIQLLLQEYCGVSKEDAKRLGDMTKAERAMILEEAVLNEE